MTAAPEAILDDSEVDRNITPPSCAAWTAKFGQATADGPVSVKPLPIHEP